MQQYRVNYPLLIGLIVGGVICSGAVYGVWKFQLSRTSGWLIGEADRAAEAGDLRKARAYYGQYLSIQNQDDKVRFKYANTMLDVTNQDDVTIEDFTQAARFLESLLRNSEHNTKPEAKALRRRLVELYGRNSIKNYSTALEHLDLLLADDPKNTELQALCAKYLIGAKDIPKATEYSYQLIGYDPKENKFDAKKASAPHEVEVYANLAGIVRGKDNQPEFADRILDQMIEANPKSAEAYVQRGRLHTAWGNADAARADAEKAYQLKPDDVDVLLFMADAASQNENYEKAREYVDKAKKLHPEETRIYQASALLDVKDKQYDKALAQIDEGIKNVSGSKKMELLFFKVELQIPQGDIKGARQTIGDLRGIRNLNNDIIDYFEARLLMAEGNWFAASEAFNKLRPKVAAFGPQRVMEVDYSLGLCYERLGRPDVALDQYELVLQQDPENAPAAGWHSACQCSARHRLEGQRQRQLAERC